MARKWIEKIEPEFEKLLGRLPSVFLDHHPDQELVAMQVIAWIETQTERAAIWNTKSKQIEWKLDDANALCWTSDGKEILILREKYEPKPEERVTPSGIRIVTPLQSEFSYSFERRTWPDKQVIASCKLENPTGWWVDVVASPTQPLACCVWVDQCEAGIEWVRWKEGRLTQEFNQGYFGHSQFLEGPVFNSDGSYLGFSYTEDAWWSNDLETSSPSGEFKVGWVVICDTSNFMYREIEIQTKVAPGWTPEHFEETEEAILSSPVFVDSKSFTVKLPTGEEQTFFL